MINLKVLLAGSAAVGALLLSAGMSMAADVTYERLLNPEPGNWLMNSRTYNSNRYSPLDEVNKDTVKGLKLAFAVPLMPPSQGSAFATSALQGTPLVEDGIMFATDGWGRLYRINMTAGDRGLIEWIMDPKTDPEVATGILNNRGASLYGDAVYSMSPDGRLICTDKVTGEIRWQVETQLNPAEYFSMAPLAIKDKIIMGPAGGDGPMRGRIEARSPVDGELLWTFHTVPEPGEPGNDTWEGNSWETGGSATWVTGSFDPELNQIVYGVGNPNPAFDPAARRGDNLYSDSTVAINADTGELNWYFQYTPNDSWDYDEVGIQQLLTTKIGGTDTKVVARYARNGFFYTLDAKTGKFLAGSQYAKNVTWTKGLNMETGKPLEYDPALKEQAYLADTRAGKDKPIFGPDALKDFKFCPYIEGGVNMYPTSFSEKTGLVYGLQIEGCHAGPLGAQRDAENPLTGAMLAVDPATAQVVKRLDMTTTGRSGALATAGGVVFGGNTGGDFFAVDDTSLEKLWNINLGTVIDAPPITFQINGKQYVAVAVGPGGIPLDFHHYAAQGTDPNAAAMMNFQKSSTIYVFSL